MEFDVDIWDLLIFAGIVWFGSRVVDAAKVISREFKRFSNYGLTDEQDEAARATILDPKATTAAKLDAIARLRTKVDTAKAAGYGVQVRAADQALTLLEKELRAQDELAPLRAEWLARQKAGKK